ncbi:predicted protein [Botrytis cinerea T4]|uniref:Uncharacterized protein n=1 Tax=Botryotinia fuckeliana (strain T4) TaxID=999810 RepID=G2YK27_BOTF4|nr:predicted protein [Botrytis cinerea T4]
MENVTVEVLGFPNAGRAAAAVGCRFGELLHEGCNVLEMTGLGLPLPGSRTV